MQATSSSLIASIVTPTGSTGRLEGAQLGGKLLHSGPTATVVIGAAAAHPHCSQKELGQLEIVQMDLRKCRGIIRVIPSRVLKAKQSKAKQSKAKQSKPQKGKQGNSLKSFRIGSCTRRPRSTRCSTPGTGDSRPKASVVLPVHSRVTAVRDHWYGNLKQRHG